MIGLAAAALLAGAPRLYKLIADLASDGDGVPAWFSDALGTFEGLWIGLWLVAGAVWLGHVGVSRRPEPERNARAPILPTAPIAIATAGVLLGVANGFLDVLPDLVLAIAGVAGILALVAATVVLWRAGRRSDA